MQCIGKSFVSKPEETWPCDAARFQCRNALCRVSVSLNRLLCPGTKYNNSRHYSLQCHVAQKMHIEKQLGQCDLNLANWIRQGAQNRKLIHWVSFIIKCATRLNGVWDHELWRVLYLINNGSMIYPRLMITLLKYLLTRSSRRLQAFHTADNLAIEWPCQKKKD